MNPPRTWIVAKVVIFRPDHKLLALRRSHTAPHHALTWDLPGGLIEYGEDPIVGLVRETKEESGLEITDPSPVLVTSSLPGGNYEICIYFKSRVQISLVTLSYEHDLAKWVSPKQFSKLDTPPGYHEAVMAADKRSDGSDQ